MPTLLCSTTSHGLKLRCQVRNGGLAQVLLNSCILRCRLWHSTPTAITHIFFAGMRWTPSALTDCMLALTVREEMNVLLMCSRKAGGMRGSHSSQPEGGHLHDWQRKEGQGRPRAAATEDLPRHKQGGQRTNKGYLSSGGLLALSTGPQKLCVAFAWHSS